MRLLRASRRATLDDDSPITQLVALEEEATDDDEWQVSTWVDAVTMPIRSKHPTLADAEHEYARRLIQYHG